ncbi:hypothetical protein [Acidovorax sp.]|nr:hypothetical protein [Acidovorax sp.]
MAFDVDSRYEPVQGLHRTIQRWVCKAPRASVMLAKGKETFVWEF